MKKYLLYAGGVIFPLGIVALVAFAGGSKAKVSASGDGIRFIESSWSAAVEKAEKENKLIFLDAYASWCGPCKMLKASTFTKKEAGDFFNTHYVNVAIDMEKGEGIGLAQKFHITAYPTLIIADKSGNLITYTQGYMDAHSLVQFGQYGLQKQ